MSLAPVRSERASGCCSAQRNDNRLTAVMLSTKMVSYLSRFSSATADGFVMRLRITGRRRKGRVRTADATGQVARRLPIVDSDRIDRQILHGEIAGLDVEEQDTRRIERAQQRGLADTGWADDQRFDATPFSEALIG